MNNDLTILAMFLVFRIAWFIIISGLPRPQLRPKLIKWPKTRFFNQFNLQDIISVSNSYVIEHVFIMVLLYSIIQKGPKTLLLDGFMYTIDL